MGEELKAKDDEILELFKMCNEKDKEIERLNKELEKYKYSADELNEIERLNNIIKEAKEYIESELWNYFEERNVYLKVRDSFLEILDKEGNVDE